MKGVDVLLRAFAGIGDRDTSLHIVGDGSLRAELEGLASSLRIQDRVTFLGRLTGDALLREYAEAEVFVGLSRSEALGNVFLEAQAAGCAVVATTVGGIPEIVSDGSTGILVPPDHPKDAQIVMEKFLGDRVLLQAMGARGITTSAEYDWQLITTKYRQVLLAAIG
jgi:glycosyltransferase involved in cell wall biosynthesis